MGHRHWRRQLAQWTVFRRTSLMFAERDTVTSLSPVKVLDQWPLIIYASYSDPRRSPNSNLVKGIEKFVAFQVGQIMHATNELLIQRIWLNSSSRLYALRRGISSFFYYHLSKLSYIRTTLKGWRSMWDLRSPFPLQRVRSTAERSFLELRVLCRIILDANILHQLCRFLGRHAVGDEVPETVAANN